MINRLFALGLTLWCTASFAAPLEDLISVLGPMTQLSAKFEQNITDEKGKSIGQSRGTFSFSRPGRFRWEVDSPAHTLLVADGKNVWNYDEDLEQVSVNPLQGQENTPAILLSGDTHKIESLFNVDQTKNCQDQQKCYHLTPKQKDGMLQWIQISFKGQQLSSMQFKDQIGNMTSLKFNQLLNHPKLEPGLFLFKVPKGVDVVGTPSK